MKPQTAERKIYSVAELNRSARDLIEGELSQIWVEGEISNLVRPASGHWYFSLKDEKAQVRCAMFAGRNRNIRFRPKDGMQVILRGKASIYEGRGEYQLIAENLMQAGAGLLQQRFEELKQKLADEGLFAEEHKQTLPSLPKHIAVITSSTGAAIRDILTVLKRRFPAIPVTVLPTLVQGTGASRQIVNAIELANRPPDGLTPFDIIILGRGGGSLEDLWCFNEERVARAIYASKVPIVSAVGHEIDFTISDFVADLRAPTPSAAAELVTPDQEEYQRSIFGYAQYLMESITRQIELQQHHLKSLQKRLRHPGRQLQDYSQRLDQIDIQLARTARNQIELCRARAERLQAELTGNQPSFRIENLALQNSQFEQRLLSSIKQIISHSQLRLKSNAQALNTLNPLETLERGYAIAMDQQENILRDSSQVAIGERITTRLAKGRINCSVDSIEST